MIRVARKEMQVSSLPFSFPVLLQSDLHLFSPESRLDVISKELKIAREKGARVNLNGDVMDCIVPSDLKRFAMAGVDAKVNSLLNSTIDLAMDVLGPYADLIDVISMGNHESAILKHHSLNLTSWLVERLNTKKGAKVQYGGFGGYIQYRFNYCKRAGASYWIRYHHGVGSSAIVTRGTIDFTRSAAWQPDADMIWIGHKHFQNHNVYEHERVTAAGRVYTHQIHCVMTGGYLDQLKANQDSLADPYPTQGNMQHLPIGGVFFDLNCAGQHGNRTAIVIKPKNFNFGP